MEHLLTVLIGFFSGAAGSLIAPWIHWGIEKRRDKRTIRRDLIIKTRQHISSKSFSGFQFSKETYFIQLKPYFEEKVIDWIEEFERYYEVVDDNSTMHEDLKVEILKQLQRIEKNWGSL